MNNWDVIVIGAGHNGLTAAASLAKSGRKVLILEKNDRAGGLASSEELHAGYRTQGLLLDTSGIRREVVRNLDLERHGLKFLSEETPVLVPQEKGPGLLLYRDPAKAEPELRKISESDARRYAKFRAFICRVRPFARRLLGKQPPGVMPQGMADWTALAGTGLSLRLLGQKDMLELLRIAPMCAADWLNEWFTNDLLKAALASPGLWGTYMGPWSAGSVATLLLKECAAELEVQGGPAALARALEKAAKASGAEIRLSSPARAVRFKGGKVSGVVLEDGSELSAQVVVSSCDPKRTFYGLIAPSDLPLDLERQVRAFRTRGTAAKVNLALSGPLEFACRPGQRFAAARTGLKLDDLEKAFDAVKYRRFSEKPMLEIRVPTISDPSLAPAGHHVAEIMVHFAPHDLAGGWTEQSRQALGDTVVGTLEAYAPRLRERLVARQVLTPADLEARYGLTGGHIYHGEHSLDQLYALRPNADCARYRTPLPGLFLAGGGSHPGGGITCAPGALAAKAIIGNKL